MTKSEQKTVRVMPLEMAKKYASTIVPQASDVLQLSIQPEQSLRAESYLVEYLDDCTKHQGETITAGAFARLAMTAVMKTVMIYQIENMDLE